MSDAVAGLTVTAVAGPEAISYAAIAGLPAAQGLYTGFLAPLAYAITGSSPQLITGPTAIMCILTNNAIPTTWDGKEVQPPGSKEPTETRVQLAALLSLTVALIQLLCAVFRLGGLVTLISTPVVAGFTSGSALLTASSQLSTLMGMPKCVGSSGGSCTVYEAIKYTADNQHLINGNVVVMSLVCVLILLLFKFGPALFRLPPSFKIVSNLAPLLLVIITVPVVAWDGARLEGWGLDPPKTIPPGLPTPLLPFDTSLTTTTDSSDYLNLLASAFPLAVIGYMGAVTIAKTASRQHGPYPIDTQQEMWSQVACNTACGVGRGIPITGSFSRTAVNCSSGATTAMSSLLSAAFMAIALQALASTLSLVPSVARAAIVVVAIAKMVELHLFASLWRSDKRDFLVFTLSFAVTSLASAAAGLAAGIIAQWLVALTRTTLQPSPVRLLGWVRPATSAAAEEAGDRTLSGKGAAVTSKDAANAGYEWTQLGPDARASSTGEDASAATGIAVSLSVSPDLQFACADRLASHISEAVAIYSPAVMLLDCTGVASADTTGAAALLASAEDCLRNGGSQGAAAPAGGSTAPGAPAPGTHSAARGCLVIAHSLSRAAASIIAAVSGGNKVSESASESLSRLLETCDRLGITGARTLGCLTTVRSQASALQLAKEVCAGWLAAGADNDVPAATGSGVLSINAGGGDERLDAPLLVADADEERDDDQRSGPVATAYKTSSSSSSSSVPAPSGVPLSPHVQARQQIRRSKSKANNAVPAASDDGDDEDAEAEKSAAGGATTLAWLSGVVSSTKAGLALLLDDTRPLLRVVKD